MTQNTDPRTEPVARELKDETPLSPMRTTIADRLQESYRDAAHVTLTREASLPPLEPGLAQIASETTTPSIIDVLLKSVSEALTAHPAFNATYDAAEKTHRTYHEHNVGIATDIDDGLVVPVLSDLRDDSIIDIHRQRTAVVGRVQRGSFTMSDFEHGTFTVSNLGPLGVDTFTPIINPPQVAILGVGRLRDVSAQQSMQDAPSSQIGLSLSFDHRVVDGADGARFLDTIVQSTTTALET